MKNSVFDFIFKNPIGLLVSIFIPFVIIYIFYVLFSRFQKTITIKNKYTTSTGSKIIYTISDSNNNIYTIENVWFYGNFNKAQTYNSINLNSNYNVSGYGYTMNPISLYPSIYEITPA